MVLAMRSACRCSSLVPVLLGSRRRASKGTMGQPDSKTCSIGMWRPPKALLCTRKMAISCTFRASERSESCQINPNQVRRARYLRAAALRKGFSSPTKPSAAAKPAVKALSVPKKQSPSVSLSERRELRLQKTGKDRSDMMFR